MTTDLDARIKQFKNMAEADPNNELGHFSLGKAYCDAGRFAEAIEPLNRALTLDPTLSKAYQFLGDAHEKSGDRAKAIEVMTRGVTVADERGDRMPRDAMADRLRNWGTPVPAFRQIASTGPTGPEEGGGASGFQCSRCGRPHGKMVKVPFKGPLGEKIFANVCTTCFKEWIPMGTKVINELALQLTTKAGQDTYDQYMIEFLQLEDR